MKFLSLANAIKLMMIIGVIAVFSVAVQSCQSPKDNDIIRVSEKKLEIAQFKTGSMKRLTVLENPPVQPNSKFVDGQENVMQLTDFQGKYVVLNVWATWCPPCVVEMPSLNKLASEYNGEDLVVLTISMDKDDASIETFFAANDLAHLTRWRDSNLNIAGALKVRGLPITVFYDRRGHEIARVPGEADWASDEAKALVREILGE